MGNSLKVAGPAYVDKELATPHCYESPSVLYGHICKFMTGLLICRRLDMTAIGSRP